MPATEGDGQPLESFAAEGRVKFNLLTLLVLMLVNLVIAYPLIYIVSASFSSANTVMAGRVWLLPVDSFSKSL